MYVDDDIETVADSLGGDIVVAGPGAAVADQASVDGQPRVVRTGDVDRFRDAVRDAGLVVVTVNSAGSGPGTAESIARVVDDTVGYVVAVVDAHEEERIEQSLLEPVRNAADVTLLSCGDRSPADRPPEQDNPTGAQTRQSRSSAGIGGAFDFIRMIREPGHVNLDLADARTVLTDGSLAALCGGTASLKRDGPAEAVRCAFEGMPSSIHPAQGSGALAWVAGGPGLSIGDAIAAVRAVRGELGAVEELIWGVALDDALAGRVAVDVVVDDVTYRPALSAGDPCRRCGAALVTYSLGEQTTLACEACGFADLSMSLRDRSGRDAGL